MTRTNRFATLSVISLLLAADAVAQYGPPGPPPGRGGPPPGYVRHNDWRRGRRMPPDYWSRGRPVDYRRYRLRRPPRGYAWREVDGNYVLAAVATGLIASVVAASAANR